jgi:hypothetical protein
LANEEYYRYYVRINVDNDVIRFFNSTFETPLPTDIFYQTSEERNLHLEVLNIYGQYLYKYENDTIVEKTPEELNYLDELKREKCEQADALAQDAMNTNFPEWKRNNITNRIGATDQDYINMMTYFNSINTALLAKKLEINAQTTASGVNLVSIDIFNAIAVPTTPPVPDEAVNKFTGVYTIRKKVALTSNDINNKYIVLDQKAEGDPGEKDFVQVIPSGALSQDYGVDYIAMNNDANTKLVIIWSSSGTITGIASPVFPTGLDLSELLDATDTLTVLYR